MKKCVLRIMIMILLVTSTLVGCSSNSNDNANVDETASVQGKGTVYFMSGKIQADESAVITSKINARVSEIGVDVGSIVNKGDNIITLDTKDLEAQVGQAEAAVEVAQANLNKIKSGSRPEQIEQATAALESAKANYENAKANNERNKDVYNAGGMSKSQLDQSETALTAAESGCKSAQATLDMLNKGETAESIAISEAQVKSAQAALNTAQVQLQNREIVSPVSGIVTSKNINNGELAAVGAPLLSIVNLDCIVINAYLPSTYINKISVNQAVVIKVSEIPDKEFQGEISVIDPAVDSKNKNVLVKVKFDDKDPLLKPGMFAEIGIRE
ncbi:MULTISPECIES: efflux RND transporter periplasmic adaptor subunit [unclassified Clostridium]|uniref:HlyD family secretion protein n=1 Tax=unclassified Clostridium TaxID=2614128 RepID=UPI000297C53B|nr:MULTISPECIES: efflux RND transporter periplasmic adaptor subunit [unclassified Clostridium]EKQ51571.1 MAG: RND family efflux transporter, MFP subunit [Clostridium sp. Maddingley MBC34-26]